MTICSPNLSIFKLGRFLAAVALVTLTKGAALRADLTSQGPPLKIAAAPVLALSDLAYDDKHDAYLQVWGDAPAAWARLVASNGTFIGPSIQISCPAPASCKYGQSPRVAYSRGTTDDIFFVALSTDKISPDKKTIWGQLVRYTVNGAQRVGGNVALSVNTLVLGHNQTVGGIVYNPLKKEFMVAWTERRLVGTNIFDYDIFVRGFTLTRSTGVVNGIGAATFRDLNVSANAQWAQVRPDIAFDPVTQKYLIVFDGGDPATTTAEVLGIWGKLLLDTSTTRTLSGLIRINRGGYQIESASIYLPGPKQFLVTWAQILGGAPRTVMGRVVRPSDGLLVTTAYPILATPQGQGAPQGEAGATNVFVATMHGSGWLCGSELTAAGAFQNVVFRASNVVPTNGTYRPRVASGAGGQFGLNYVLNRTSVWFERKIPGTHLRNCGSVVP